MKRNPVIYATLASLLPCAVMASPSQETSASSFQQPAVTLEGYVRYEGGKPAKGYWVSLDSQSYQTQGRTDVIPFDIPRKAAGAIVFNDPNAVENHFTSARSVKVDSRGHYAFEGLTPGTPCQPFSSRGRRSANAHPRKELENHGHRTPDQRQPRKR